jgi:adenosylcobinamide-phosphate synthase
VKARLLGSALGILLDEALGEPAIEPHPVAAYGQTMERLEQRWWADDQARGVAYTAVGVLGPALAGRVIGSGPVQTAAASYLAIAGRSLREAASGVAEELARDDLDGARTAIRSLVGRDPEHLDAHDIARAAVESVAENTVDAVVAPALWAAALGPAGALGYRATNTLDAMVGYRNDRYRRFGWASARLDDLANLVPARVTALLVAACRPERAAAVVRHVRRDAGAHPSPNAGVAEAAFAAALRVQLGGTNRYGDRVEERGLLGEGPPPDAAAIAGACALSRDVGLLLASTLIALGRR